MKFSFLAVCVVCFLAFAKADAQTMQEVDQPWWFLVTGGYVTGNLSEDGSKQDFSGFSAAFTAERELSDLFSIDLRMASENVWSDDEGIHYISPSLLARLFFADGVSIAAGPEYGFLISDDLDGQLESGFWALDADIMLELHSGWLIKTSYTYGLSPVSTLNENLRISFFTVGLGYRFNLTVIYFESQHHNLGLLRIKPIISIP